MGNKISCVFWHKQYLTSPYYDEHHKRLYKIHEKEATEYPILDWSVHV